MEIDRHTADRQIVSVGWIEVEREVESPTEREKERCNIRTVTDRDSSKAVN